MEGVHFIQTLQGHPEVASGLHQEAQAEVFPADRHALLQGLHEVHLQVRHGAAALAPKEATKRETIDSCILHLKGLFY
jgi:hypothetical protein